MRLRFSNTLPVEDLRRQVDMMVGELVALGVEQLARVNIYFQPRRGGQPVVVRTAEGTEVDIIEIGPRTRAFAVVDVQDFSTDRPKKAKKPK